MLQPRHLDLKVKITGIQASPNIGDGGAGRKVSMRLFQASQASRSACLHASAARLADARTEAPYMPSRDFVPMLSLPFGQAARN